MLTYKKKEFKKSLLFTMVFVVLMEAVCILVQQYVLGGLVAVLAVAYFFAYVFTRYKKITFDNGDITVKTFYKKPATYDITELDHIYITYEGEDFNYRFKVETVTFEENGIIKKVGKKCFSVLAAKEPITFTVPKKKKYGIDNLLSTLIRRMYKEQYLFDFPLKEDYADAFFTYYAGRVYIAREVYQDCKANMDALTKKYDLDVEIINID